VADRDRNIGIPVGRPQTIVVDLAAEVAGAQPPRPRPDEHADLWDQVLVGRPASGLVLPRASIPVRADLAERGFRPRSRPTAEPGLRFARVSAVSPEDGARPLTIPLPRRARAAGRDRRRFVVSKPGARDPWVRAVVRRAGLPPCRGLTRTFLLRGGLQQGDGRHSASPRTWCFPLPFHGMPRYPYGARGKRRNACAGRAEAGGTLTSGPWRGPLPDRAGRGGSGSDRFQACGRGRGGERVRRAGVASVQSVGQGPRPSEGAKTAPSRCERRSD